MWVISKIYFRQYNTFSNMNADLVYNEVLSEYYGINCNCQPKDNNSFWIDHIIKNLNINGKWGTQLQILFQSTK